MRWSSGAFELARQISVTNVNNLPMEVHLIPRDCYEPAERAARQGEFRAQVSPGTEHPMP
jgi:quinoprotein glucose dehydrogenase